MSTLESPLALLLDLRAGVYSIHPDLHRLPAMQLFCTLRAVNHELLAASKKRMEEFLRFMSVVPKGGELPPAHKALAMMQTELHLMRYVQQHACSDDRIVAGSWALKRLLQQHNAEGNWAPADMDVMTRGVQETDAVIVDSKAYWFNLGYTVRCERYDVRRTDYYTGEGRADDHNRLRQLIRAWVEENAGDMQYARLIGELGRVVDNLPPQLLGARPWRIPTVQGGNDNGRPCFVPYKLTVTRPHGTSHCINVIPYVYVNGDLPRVPGTLTGRMTAFLNAFLAPPMESIVESFDILQCAVWCRMNENKNGYTFGGPGMTAILQSLEVGGIGPILPLQLTNCAFATSTKAYDDEPVGPATDEQMKIIVERQMKRIAKYMSRGFRFAE